MAEHWESSLIEGIKKFLTSSEYADLTLIIEDKEEHKVHRLLVCSQSDFFAAACRNFKEAETGIIRLKHGRPEALRMMIRWLKTGEYCATCPKIKHDADQEDESDTSRGSVADAWWSLCDHPMSLDIEMYALADFYQLPGLRKSAMGYFEPKLQELTNRCATKAKQVEQSKCACKGQPEFEFVHGEGLNDRPVRRVKKTSNVSESSLNHDIDMLINALAELQTSTPSSNTGLRDIAISSIVEDFADLIKLPKVQDALAESPEFNIQLMKKLGEELELRKVKGLHVEPRFGWGPESPREPDHRNGLGWAS